MQNRTDFTTIILISKIQMQDPAHNIFADPEASNGSLFSTQFNPILKPQKSTKKNLPQLLSIEERISKIQHQIINEISIISPVRLRATQFISELRNHRYERARKNVFGENENRIDLDRHQILQTLMDLYEKFRYSISHLFYIVLSGANQNGVLYFSHRQTSKKKESSLIMSLRRCSFVSELQKEEIAFEFLEKSQMEKERILIRDKSISVFWGFLINHLIYNDIQFEVISNYQFTNSLHNLPHQTFNGAQSRQEFDHLANKKKNLLGYEEKELYHLRMQGLWLKSNVLALIQKSNSASGKKCEVLFSSLPISETLTSDLFKGKYTTKEDSF